MQRAGSAANVNLGLRRRAVKHNRRPAGECVRVRRCVCVCENEAAGERAIRSARASAPRPVRRRRWREQLRRRFHGRGHQCHM